MNNNDSAYRFAPTCFECGGRMVRPLINGLRDPDASYHCPECDGGSAFAGSGTGEPEEYERPSR